MIGNDDRGTQVLRSILILGLRSTRFVRLRLGAIPRILPILVLHLIVCGWMGAAFSAEPVKSASELSADGIRPEELRWWRREPAAVTLGGDAEVTTTTEQEREQRRVEVPSWTAAEFSYDGRRWLFLINSANTPAAFDLGGWPPGSEVSDAFSGQRIGNQPDRPWNLQLPAYGVLAIQCTDRTSGSPQP